MLADLSRVAETLREDTFAATFTRLREEIQQRLHEFGSYTIKEGGREFTITIPDHAGRSTEPPQR